MTSEKLIVELTAQRGKKFEENGECVAFHGSRKSASIVFLPRGVKPNEQVRVELQPLRSGDGKERTDSAGKVMYRATPAPVKYIEKWRDNGNGTASRVTYAVDWKLKEVEERVEETRPLQQREGHPFTTTETKVVLGDSLADSSVEQTPIRVTPLEEERVESGQIVWRRFDDVKDPQQAARCQATQVIDAGWSTWGNNKLQPVYQDDWSVTVQVSCIKADGSAASFTDNTTWGAMPLWWRAEQEKLYQVCGCSRARISSDNTKDGYTRCETCRNEETCQRCNNQPVRVSGVKGSFVCSDCKSWLECEALVNQHLPHAKRVQIAEQAQALIAGEPLDEATAQAVYEALAARVSSGFAQSFQPYPHYYRTAAGDLWGSKFNPEALELVQALPQASGNGLVKLAAWVCGDHETRNCEGRDYYWLSQVERRDATLRLDHYDLQRAAVGVLLVNMTGWRTTEAAKAAAERTKHERLGPFEAALDRYGWPQAYLLVREDGTVAVNCGKPSKMGRYDVSPCVGERFYDSPTPDQAGRETSWQPVPIGQKVSCADYTRSGNLNSRTVFTVPAELTPGIWGVVPGHGGEPDTFFTVIAYSSCDKEVVPDFQLVRYDTRSITKNAAPKPSQPQAPSAPAKAVDLTSAADAFKAAGWSVEKKPKK